MLAIIDAIDDVKIDLIYSKMKMFSNYVSIKKIKDLGEHKVYHNDVRSYFKEFDIYDIPKDAYDIMIAIHFGHYGKYFGSGGVREYTSEIIRKALRFPDKIFLLLTQITEIETRELAFECLPDENICLPNNIFFNLEDFIKQLHLLSDLLDPSPTSSVATDIKHFDGMPLLLRSLLLTPGSGKNFYGDFNYTRWGDYFNMLEKHKISLASPLMLRSIALSGVHGKKYISNKLRDAGSYKEFFADLESLNAASFERDELIDMVASLDIISSQVYDYPGFRSHAAVLAYSFVNSSLLEDPVYSIYESFILDHYKCFKHSDFIAEIISVSMGDKQGLVSACRLVRACNLLDPWEKFATAVDDREVVTTLFAQKLKEWLVLLAVPEKTHNIILDFFRDGTGKEKVENISWNITAKLQEQFGEMRSYEDVHVFNRVRGEPSFPRSHVLKKTIVNGKACFSFFHVFLDEFQADRYPELYSRLQYLWVKLYVDEVIEYISADYVSKSQYCNFLDYFSYSPQEIIVLIVKKLKSSSIPVRLSDLIRYSIFNIALFSFEDECLNVLIDVIKSDPEKIVEFYEIIKIPNIKLPVGAHAKLMEMVNAIPPDDKVMKLMRHDKRKRNREIAVILELGKMTSSSGVLLDEYLRGHDKKEYMNLVQEKLVAIKK